MRKFTLMIALIFSIATSCGGDTEEAAQNQTLKSVFDRWVRVDNEMSFDINGTDFGVLTGVLFTKATLEVCTCFIIINGTEITGTGLVSSCKYIGGGNGEPGCSALWENTGVPYSYFNNGGTFELCTSSSTCNFFY